MKYFPAWPLGTTNFEFVASKAPAVSITSSGKSNFVVLSCDIDWFVVCLLSQNGVLTPPAPVTVPVNAKLSAKFILSLCIL